MKKYFSKNCFWASLIFSYCFVPFLVQAATISFDSDQGEFFAGDKVVLNVYLNTENKNINAIEGKIKLNYDSKEVSVGNISVSGSNFSLWPRKPSLSVDGKTISFTGGTPGGLISEKALIFKLVLDLKKAGKISASPVDFAVYLNNGRGEKDIVRVQDFSAKIVVPPKNRQPINAWEELEMADHLPPNKFSIVAGADPSVFGGQKFLSFNTTDDQSGLAYYEVKEGNLPPVRSGNTYILQQQGKNSQVVVTAYDLAGNSRQIVYRSGWMVNWLWLFGGGLVFIGLVYFYLRFKNKKQNEFIN